MEVRIDKYLWAIRVFKTRTEATEACSGGKVKIGGVNAKPSKDVRPGDIINVRKGAVNYTFRVIDGLDKRVGAKLVPDYVEDLTPEEKEIVAGILNSFGTLLISSVRRYP